MIERERKRWREREKEFVCREGERDGGREKQRWRDTERVFVCMFAREREKKNVGARGRGNLSKGERERGMQITHIHADKYSSLYFSSCSSLCLKTSVGLCV